MKIKHLLLVTLLGLSLGLSAQTYSFNQSPIVYTDLVGSTSLNNGITWDDPGYTIPIGFDFEFFDTLINTIYIIDWGYGTELSADPAVLNTDFLLIPYGSDIIDRGYDTVLDVPTSTSISNISYLLSGNPGSQILKIEWNNVGFYGELFDDAISSDFVNFQLWLYEGSNNIEIHFGPNSVTQPNLSYDGSTGTHIALYPTFDFYNDAVLAPASVLTGSAATPTMSQVLDSYSDYLNGTIPANVSFNFVKLLSSNESTAKKNLDITVFPNPADQSFNLTINEKNLNIETLIVMDSRGKKMREISYTGKAIDISELSSGAYFVELITNTGQRATRKLIKE